MRLKNCCHKRTPLEVALILILLVSVAFLIGMIITYVSFASGEKSVKCKTFCNRMNMTYIPPNLRRNRNLEDKVPCTTDSKNDYPFLASVIQNVYDDNYEEQRYLGAAAVMNPKWVLSSAQFVKDASKNFKRSEGLYVRAGSKYWSKEGLVHDIDQMIPVTGEEGEKTFLVLISLKQLFPEFDTIHIIKLGRKSVMAERSSSLLTMHGWKTNDNLPLHKRLKFQPAESKEIKILRNSECDDVNEGLLNVFCGVEVVPSETCTNDLGFPLLKENVLVGLQIHEHCDPENNTAVHVFQDIAVYYDRLVDLMEP